MNASACFLSIFLFFENKNGKTTSFKLFYFLCIVWSILFHFYGEIHIVPRSTYFICFLPVKNGILSSLTLFSHHSNTRKYILLKTLNARMQIADRNIVQLYNLSCRW